jgi:hypothetical protein
MRIPYFNLKGARMTLISKSASIPKTSGRRHFVKTLGLGAVTINPAIEIVKSVTTEPFSVITGENSLKIIRHGLTAWDLGPTQLGNDARIRVMHKEKEWLFSVEDARFRGTDLNFSLSGRIFYNGSQWLLQLRIPNFAIQSSALLTEFLDGDTELISECILNQTIAEKAGDFRLSMNGHFNWQMNAGWRMQFSGDGRIRLDYCGHSAPLQDISITPGHVPANSFMYKAAQQGTLITFHETTPEIFSWHAGSKLSSEPGYLPQWNLFTGTTSRNRPYQVMWAESSGRSLLLQEGMAGEFRLRDYFLGTFFLNAAPPQFYLSARLDSEDGWITNPVGAFRFSRNNDKPDFEAFGYGTQITEEYFEPRMRAFHPRIKGGISTPALFEDLPVIRIEDQQPVRRTVSPALKKVTAPTVTPPPAEETPTEQTQDPVRRTQVTQPARTAEPAQQDPVRQVAQPTIQVEFNKIKFRPRKAMTLKILRAEDLVWLDFEFHNFRFSNKGQSSFLELDNSKEPGIVVIYFPTQHTLEEAWYEVTQADTGTSQEVRLPARHIRAERSRLVYELAAGHTGFELTMEQLMDWSKYKLRVHPRAWVKLPQIISINPVSYSSESIKTPGRTTQNLAVTGPANDFRLRMAEQTRNISVRREVYNESAVSQTLAADRVSSLSPSFDITKLKIDMSVGPVPELSTSIEAPALLYISPNQVSDFSHLTVPQFRDTDEARETGQVITTQFRVLDPLNTSKGEITELWHTALGIKLGNQKVSLLTLKNLKTIRALWAFDAQKDYRGCADIDQPFQASLDASDRHKLVHTTSNYSIQGFTPIPVPVKQLMLSTLGAYIDLHAFFDVPPPADDHLNVIEWQHLATLGRDHYVKIVREGYLFPLGHRAALVKVTERKFDRTTRAAVNKMRMYIVVLQKEVLYRRKDPAGKFIKFPFQAVRVETETTPDIDKPVNIPLGSNIPQFRIPSTQTPCKQKPGRSSTYNFYIHVSGKGYPFDVTVIDMEGAEHKINMPLAFVENNVGRTKNMVESMAANYNSQKQYTDIGFAGREVAYAECLVDGDTAFETQTFTFGAQYYPDPGQSSLKFHPNMQSSKVFIKQVDEMTGTRNAAKIELEDDQNDGYVFARVSDAVVDFTGGSDKAGGFMTPNMAITGLSKLQGPVGGNVEDMMKLDFVPEAFFKALESFPAAKIFGVIDLFMLLKSKPDLKGSFTPMINQIRAAKQEIEKLKEEVLLLQHEAKETGKNLESQINQKKNEIKSQTDKLLKALNDQTPKVPNLKTWFTQEAFYAEYKWIPEFDKKDISLFDGILGVHIEKPMEALQITTTFTKPFNGSVPASLNGSAKFSNFGIKIVDALVVNFNFMNFLSGTNKKTDVKVDLNKSKPIEFVGALSFVNNLQSLIPSTGFSDDGPFVELSAKGVKAGFNLSVPDVEVGVLMISNITLGAYVNLPFNGDELTMGFNFCRRENPFMLTVSCFGGGGFFMMVTTLKGLKSIEAAFEFGAAVSLNLGVASGGVSIMGGFYFKFEIVSPGVEELSLTGYIRINGNLSVLGIITVSLEFYLALTAIYVEKTLGTGEKVKKVEKMEGVASLKVKVEVLFFSKTVTVTVRRQFAGADADPTFAEMIPPEDWQEYCLAFEN